MKLGLHVGARLRTQDAARRLEVGRSIVELKLQFGYGMMEHTRHLLSAWGGGGVILSPRDLSHDQLVKLGREVCQLSVVGPLLDPQFYLPHADHERLTAHDYWPREFDSMTWDAAQVGSMLKKLQSLNRAVGTSEFILPGWLAGRVDDDWVAHQQLVIDEADRLGIAASRLATIALSGDAIRSEDQVHELLDRASVWNVRGYYVVIEHPKAEYLVSDATWMMNVLDLCAGLKLKGKVVIVGYCSHQMLPLAAAGVDTICSGTWLNVRSFPQDKFRIPDDEIKQKTTWYYCAPALSEYKIPFLDIARRVGMLDRMRPPAALGSPYADALFSGVQPTAAGFTEQAAFRHYLQTLHSQAQSARKETFDATVDELNRELDSAEALLRALAGAGVTGQARDFGGAVDAARAGLAVLKANRGATLARRWSALSRRPP